MIEKWRKVNLRIDNLEMQLEEKTGGIISRIDYIEDERSKCIAPELSKSTHNELKWCISQIQRLNQVTPEIMHQIEKLEFFYEDYEEATLKLKRTRVFFKSLKLKRLKIMNENLQKAVGILGEIAEKFSENEEIGRLIQEKLPDYAVKLIDAKEAIIAGDPDLDGNGTVTTIEQMAYDVGKPIIDKAIKNAKQKFENTPSKTTFWVDRVFKIISGLGWIIFLILQITQLN